MLENGAGNAALKNVLSSKPPCNVQTLLPTLKLAPLVVAPALDTAEFFESVILVVVEIDIQSIPDVASNLTPGALPLVGPGSSIYTAHGVPGAGKEVLTTTASACSAACIPAKTSGRRALCIRLVHSLAKKRNTLHAEPCTFWHAFQSNAVGMVGCVTPVAE